MGNPWIFIRRSCGRTGKNLWITIDVVDKKIHSSREEKIMSIKNRKKEGKDEKFFCGSFCENRGWLKIGGNKDIYLKKIVSNHVEKRRFKA